MTFWAGVSLLPLLTAVRGRVASVCSVRQLGQLLPGDHCGGTLGHGPHLGPQSLASGGRRIWGLGAHSPGAPQVVVGAQAAAPRLRQAVPGRCAPT